ncbi:MAG: hypothetical protein NWF07_11715 [Candidatus Bathyarchaeota archaeon]|nr:hypothetical protein [Candidatus Bathyarchaeota archaeon]
MSERHSQNQTPNSKTSTRILFSALWISHFLLWSFGDMLTLLQETGEPITETIIMVIAPSLAIIQTIMIVYSLRGAPRGVRWSNILVPLVYLLFNIQYLAESSAIWNIILGFAYIICNIMIIWNAWKWRSPDTIGDDDL